MEIIDTHIHIWDLENIDYEWLKGDTSILGRTYDIEELNDQREEAGITGGILVQAANNFDDTNWMLHQANQTEWLKGVVGWVPLMSPEATREALVGNYLNNSYFKGVRHLIHDEKDPKWLLQGEVIEGLKILASHNIPFDIVGVLPEHIETALEVASLVPDLKMVFDHMNQPPIAKKEQFGRWGELMKEAAKHPHFYLKISGLGTASGDFEGWTGEDIKPYISFAFDNFGLDRCFCGGDWPVSRLAGEYVATWTVYQQLLKEMLSGNELEKVFSGNARDFYDL